MEVWKMNVGMGEVVVMESRDCSCMKRVVKKKEENERGGDEKRYEKCRKGYEGESE